jgi:hypothetical protein
VKQQILNYVPHVDCRILGFFEQKQHQAKSVESVDHDAAESAVTAAYFRAFLVKGN